MQQVEEYLQELGPASFTASYFHDYYSGKGWKVGRTKIQDWRAVLRVWVGRNVNQGSRSYTRNSREDKTQRLQSAETARMDDIERQIRERDARLAEQKARSVSMEEYKRMKAEGRI